MEVNSSHDELFNALLKIAAEEALIQEIDEMPSCAELNAKYIPSHDLNKRICKIILQHKLKGKVYAWRKIATKMTAVVALVVLFSLMVLLSVEATRNYFFNAVIKWQEDYFSIENDNDSINVSITTNYGFNYLPDDFREVSTSVTNGITRIIYQNGDGTIITFKFCSSNTSKILTDDENKKYRNTTINGNKAYLFEATEVDKKDYSNSST